MGAVAGCEEEKGKRKQFGPRRHSTTEWPPGREGADRHRDQGRNRVARELSIEVVFVESSSGLSVRVLFIVIEVVSTSPLAVPAFQRSHCLFGVWMRA